MKILNVAKTGLTTELETKTHRGIIQTNVKLLKYIKDRIVASYIWKKKLYKIG